MKVSLRQVVGSILALFVAVVVVVAISENPARFGSESLIVRSLILGIAIIAALVAVYPFNPLFKGRPGPYGAVVCLPAVVPVFIYYLFFLPSQAGEGLSAEQLQNQLITDSSSNGIIEVGFSYPIYTPTLSISNHELFTRQVNVFLRMVDASDETSLYRAVRSHIPGASLSVEATVRGMLSRNAEYEFNPIDLPPGRSVVGKVVFVISNLEDGASFTEALSRAKQVQIELREPETGGLLLMFPVERTL